MLLPTRAAVALFLATSAAACGPVAVLAPIACEGAAECSSQRVALSVEHGCAVQRDGQLACWGRNNFGQALPGQPAEREPVAFTIPSLGAVRAVAVDEGRTCAALGNGSVRCWGDNSRGGLGDGTTIDSVTPRDALGLQGVEALALGRQVGCARVAGLRWLCWGEAQFGNEHTPWGSHLLSLGSVRWTGIEAVAAPAPAATGAVELAMTDAMGCLRTAAGEVRCWGSRYYDTLWGFPAAIAGVADASRIALSLELACALRRGGTVSCWSLDHVAASVDGLSDVVELVAGAQRNFCALRADRSVWCWDYRAAWSTPNAPPQPRALPPSTALFGGGFLCARGDDGHTRCWGTDDRHGQLAHGPADASSAGVQVLDLEGATQLTSEAGSTCALRGDGTVACWGSSDLDPTSGAVEVDRSRATTVQGLTDVVRLSGNCAVRRDGTGVCWDRTRWGRAVRGTQAVGAFDELEGSVAQLTGRDPWGPCYTRDDGSAQCQIGYYYQPTGPEVVAQLENVGGTFCVRLDSGGVWCLGVDAPLLDSTPYVGGFVALSDRATSIAVVAGGLCATLRSGRVECAGAVANVGVPALLSGIQAVPAMQGATSLGLTATGCCGLFDQGVVRCVGRGLYGELRAATGGTAPALLVARGARALVSERERTCVLLDDGTARCFGLDALGSLGSGRGAVEPGPSSLLGY